MPVTNALPHVVAAEPGIVTLADLPPVTGRIRG
jgi:4-hydroxy-tetrahydrodipicolinate reductase